MKIIVNGSLPIEWKKALKEMIASKKIVTWKFVKEGEYERLVHTGDKQYEDVVIRLVQPGKNEIEKGVKYTHFIPAVRESVKGEEEIEVAKSHFGVVLGRFAEVLNCHFPKIKNYKTEL